MSAPSTPRSHPPPSSRPHPYNARRVDPPIDDMPYLRTRHEEYSPPRRSRAHPYTVPAQPVNVGRSYPINTGHDTVPPRLRNHFVTSPINSPSSQAHMGPRGNRYVPVDPFRRRAARANDTQHPPIHSVVPITPVAPVTPIAPTIPVIPVQPPAQAPPIIISSSPRSSLSRSSRSPQPIIIQPAPAIIPPGPIQIPEPIINERQWDDEISDTRGRSRRRMSGYSPRSSISRPSGSYARSRGSSPSRSRSRSSRSQSLARSDFQRSRQSPIDQPSIIESSSSFQRSRSRSPLSVQHGFPYPAPHTPTPTTPPIEVEKSSVETFVTPPELPSYPTIPPIHIPYRVLVPPGWDLPPPTTASPPQEKWLHKAIDLTLDCLQEVYLGILLGLPRMYFSRVSKIFTDAELYQSELERMYRVSDKEMLDEEIFNKYQNTQTMDLNVLHLLRFKNTWEEFINGMITEWQVQNVVGVLLLSAVLTLLQIDDIGGDPLSRTTAIFSLVFGLTALLHGCAFMARFGSMKKLYKAAVWAEEARSTTTSIIWNVWVFLALPTVWLAWSIIAFIVTVLSYVWRTGANEEHIPLSSYHVLGIRIAISLTFLIGLLYFGLALRTLGRYGSVLDAQWHEKLDEWKQISTYTSALPSRSNTPHQPISKPTVIIVRSSPSPRPPSHHESWRDSPKIRIRSMSPSPQIDDAKGPYKAYLESLAEDYESFDPLLTFQIPSDERLVHSSKFSFQLADYVNVEEFMLEARIPDSYHIHLGDWRIFLKDLLDAWRGKLPIPNVSPECLLSLRDTIVGDIIQVWSNDYFNKRYLSLTLVAKDGPDSPTRLIEISPRVPDIYPKPPTMWPPVAPSEASVVLSSITERTESNPQPPTPPRPNPCLLSQQELVQTTAPIQTVLPIPVPHSPAPGQVSPKSRIIANVQLLPYEALSPAEQDEKFPFPETLAGYGVLVEEWADFITTLRNELVHSSDGHPSLELWNTTFFHPRRLSCTLDTKQILIIKGTSVAH